MHRHRGVARIGQGSRRSTGGSGCESSAGRAGEQWLTPTAEEFRSRGLDCLPAVCDIAIEGQADELAAKAIAHYNRIDILVNNAGVSWGAPYEEMSIDAWHKVLNTNVIGTHLMTRAVLPQMKKPRLRKNRQHRVGGCSGRGAEGDPRSFQLHREQRCDRGSHARSRCPVRDPRHSRQRDRSRIFSDASVRRSDRTLRGAHYSRHAFGRVGAPGELKGAILFLSAPASDYITGQILAVDGGNDRA